MHYAVLSVCVLHAVRAQGKRGHAQPARISRSRPGEALRSPTRRRVEALRANAPRAGRATPRKARTQCALSAALSSRRSPPRTSLSSGHPQVQRGAGGWWCGIGIPSIYRGVLWVPWIPAGPTLLTPCIPGSTPPDIDPSWTRWHEEVYILRARA